MVITITSPGYRYTSALTPKASTETADTSPTKKFSQVLSDQMKAQDTARTASTAKSSSAAGTTASVPSSEKSTVSKSGYVNDSGKGDNFDISVPSSLKGIFQKAAEKYGVSEKLLEAVAYHESRFEPNVTSSSGAMGVMQLMPSTAKSLGVTNAYDAEQNIMGGAKLIKNLLDMYNGDLDLAMAAYSNGPGAVKRAGNRVPDIKQAKNYVAYIDRIFPNGV